MAFSWFKKKEVIQGGRTLSGQKSCGSKNAVQIEDEKQNGPPEKNSDSPPGSTTEISNLAASTEREAVEPNQEESSGIFKRLKKGLSKTRKLLSTDLEDLFSRNRKIDDELLDELEELLITADIGVQTTMDLIQDISKASSKISSSDQLKETLQEKIRSLLSAKIPDTEKVEAKPYVIMVIGVNGVGKTTTIGKLASKNMASGKKVLIAAADTFRAAAIEQLVIWAQRAGVEIVKHKEMADPAAVAYDGIEAAMARQTDIVLIDTAGRLHTRKNLMEELKKIKRTISKKLPGAPHEVLLVLDATTGQNALSQAKLFDDALGVTGLALTKLDGTAKGGIVVSICSTLEIPLKYIGIGEKIEDLQEFDPIQFVNALF